MNKKIIIIIPVLFLLILSGVVFAFQENRQSIDDIGNKSLLEDFSDGGFRSAQSGDKSDEVENLENYSPQAVLADEIISSDNDDKKQKFDITQNLNFFAKIGEDLLGIEREVIFQPINRIIELRKNTKIPRTIKVPEEYSSIQLAIDNAETGDMVEVATGEYKENIIMKEGVSLIGASELVVSELNEFSKEEEKEEIEEEKEPSSEASELGSFSSSRRIIINETIINGGNFGNVVTFKNGITNKTEFAGFTVKNSGKSLSGIFIENSSPWIHDNIFTDNEYNIYINGELSPLIQKNIIQFSNKGIQVYNFEKREDQNGSKWGYGANSVKPVIIDNLIIDNKIGIDLYNSSALIKHNTISYNNHYKTYLGATFGIYINGSSAEISSNIITDSGICNLCAGINVDEESKGIIISYNDIWNNKNNFVCFGECIMEDNNLSEDPMFIDYINGDYKLSEESGLIGKSEKGLDIGVRW